MFCSGFTLLGRAVGLKTVFSWGKAIRMTPITMFTRSTARIRSTCCRMRPRNTTISNGKVYVVQRPGDAGSVYDDAFWEEAHYRFVVTDKLFENGTPL